MPRSPGLRWPLLIVLALLVPAAAAQTDSDSPCSDLRSRQFDFWIGEWEVTAKGELAGHNSIRPILDGCVLQESWRGAKGSAGSSFNFFDPDAGKWRQLWVWRNGTTLELEGAYDDGKMVLEGSSRDRTGKTVRNRITWYDNEDGTVRQHWQVRREAGGAWETVFDGLYRKRGDEK
jgi:hypothetical protein